MSKSIVVEKDSQKMLMLFITFFVLFIGGCSVEAAKTGNLQTTQTSTEKSQSIDQKDSKSKIEIQLDSPADTVRIFYKNLREQRFREAMLLTNLRPAIENLTDSELNELQLDFAPLARQIPADIVINGEIISGDSATVTTKLPDNETERVEMQEIKLRRENNSWIILTVDESADAEIKREGKNYFFKLRIETHHQEAKEMLNRIAKAEMVYTMQNKGVYADIPTLLSQNLLPEDIKNSDSTGYFYKIDLSSDKKSYTAKAEPAIYGKTGKLTFWFSVEKDKTSALNSKDYNGKAQPN